MKTNPNKPTDEAAPQLPPPHLLKIAKDKMGGDVTEEDLILHRVLCDLARQAYGESAHLYLETLIFVEPVIGRLFARVGCAVIEGKNNGQ